jgi:hypothetical protein
MAWYLSLMVAVFLTFVNVTLAIMGVCIVIDLWPDVKRKLGW